MTLRETPRRLFFYDANAACRPFFPKLTAGGGLYGMRPKRCTARLGSSQRLFQGGSVGARAFCTTPSLLLRLGKKRTHVQRPRVVGRERSRPHIHGVL